MVIYDYNPLKHSLPKEDYQLIINSKEKAFQAYLYYLALVNYNSNGELSFSINLSDNLSDYTISNRRDDYIVFIDSKKRTEYIIHDDKQDYYHLVILDVEAMKSGGSGTGARYYIYKDGYIKDGYIVSAY